MCLMAIIDDVDQSHVYSDSVIFSQMTMKDVNVFIFFASSFTSDDNRYNKWRYILKHLSDWKKHISFYYPIYKWGRFIDEDENNFPFYITKSEHDYDYQFIIWFLRSNCFTLNAANALAFSQCQTIHFVLAGAGYTYRRDEKLILITPLSSLIGVSIIQRLSQEN